MLTNYKKYLIENYPARTSSNYISTITKFFNLYSTFNRENVMSYINSLREQGLVGSTINNKLSALKNYNEYLVSIGETDKCVIITRDYIKKDKRAISPNKLPLKKVEKILAKVREKDTIRNYTILYLFANTGIRREECASLKLSDINFKKKTMLVDGKGNKERTLYLNNKIIAVLQNYLESPERKTKQSKYLFVSKQRGQLSLSMIDVITKPYGIAPHMLRHFFASNALASGWTEAEVAYWMGHSSVATTSIYSHPEEDDMRKKANGSSVEPNITTK